MATSTHVNVNRHDRTALIIGGGIAGFASAIFMKRAGIHATVYESYHETDKKRQKGAFMIAANGIAVLQQIGGEVWEEVSQGGPRVTDMTVFNHDVKLLAAFGIDAYGELPVFVARPVVQAALKKECDRLGIPVHYGKRLAGISEDAASGKVTATFTDESTATGDMLIGADGFGSKTRSIMFGDAIRPTYSGITGLGGCTYQPPSAAKPRLPEGPTPYNFMFGKGAFFGWQDVPANGKWFDLPANEGNYCLWFSNLPMPEEHESISLEEWRTRLLEQHKEDPEFVHYAIRECAMDMREQLWALYNLPDVPRWHKGKVCIIGDAAHAAPPSSGQGVSQALEDSVMIAKCLREAATTEEAFAKFQQIRQPRTNKIVAAGRRGANNKKTTSWFALKMRDLMIPLFMRFLRKGNAEVLSYRVEIDF